MGKTPTKEKGKPIMIIKQLIDNVIQAINNHWDNITIKEYDLRIKDIINWMEKLLEIEDRVYRFDIKPNEFTRHGGTIEYNWVDGVVYVCDSEALYDTVFNNGWLINTLIDNMFIEKDPKATEHGGNKYRVSDYGRIHFKEIYWYLMHCVKNNLNSK